MPAAKKPPSAQVEGGYRSPSGPVVGRDPGWRVVGGWLHGGTNRSVEARLLLVHSPLVGCGAWEPVAGDLAGDGYGVAVPDLAGTVTAGPPYYRRQAEVIAGCAAGRPVILVGHSRAGPLLAAAETMLGEQVRGYVMVDARLPSPGRSWMATVQPGFAARLLEMADPQGRLPPWPQWWAREELAALVPDPVVRQRLRWRGGPGA